jgi:predicted KAP-like P-loop ATPase
MKIKHQEIEIPQENPFANCKLEREPYARVLSDIVNTYADGFVLAINNEWGTGKTTFVKMWQQQLKNEGFQTIYFNAWENDFDSNPLVALMSELETLTNTNNKEVFKSVIEKGAVLVKNIAPALAKSLIKKYIVDIDEITIDTH